MTTPHPDPLPRLAPAQVFTIPAQTAQIARSAFPDGNLYLSMRDELGKIFADEQFCELYPQRGQPVEAPWRLALVTLMQFSENLTDRQAADAVCSRIDWKYILGMELADQGFHYSVLSEFRLRLILGQVEHLLFETLLKQFKERGLLKAGVRQRTDSTYVFAAFRHLNWIELVGQTLYHVLDLLAQAAPDWLRLQVSADWYERYRRNYSKSNMRFAQALKAQLARLQASQACVEAVIVGRLKPISTTS